MIDWEYEAISNLAPNSSWLRNDEGLEWGDNNSEVKPSQEEIDAEIARLQTSYDAQAYSRKREAEFPSLQECVHAILDDQLDALQAKRALIKTKFPKG